MDMTPLPMPSSGQGVFDSTTPDTGMLKRKRQPRNSACQSCSALKMKCVPSSAAGFCERCNRMSKECLLAVPKPRKRRSTNGILDGYTSPEPATRSLPPPSSTPAEHGASKPAVHVESPPVRADNDPFRARFAQALRIDSGNGLLYGVDPEFIHNSFEAFRNLAANFPFVYFHLDNHSYQIAIDRPMETLAICVVTTAANAQMQHQMSRAFRHALAAKAVVDSEASLDLLTGLLIYLAWHHQYMSKSRVCQDLYMLAGICKELGVDDSAHTMMRPNLDTQRVVLGCYYLCYNLSKVGYKRPNPVPWNSQVSQSAASLAATAAVASHRIIQPLIELTQCLEELDEAIGNSKSALGSAALPLATSLHAKSALHRLQAIKTQHSALSAHPAFATSYLLIQMRTLSLVSEPDPTTLHNTIATAKLFFENIIAAPPATLHQLPIVEWTTLLSILAFLPRLGRLSRESCSPHSMFQPETILDNLVARMSSAPANDPMIPRQDALLSQLRGICDALKRKMAYDRDLASPEGEGRFRAVNQSDAASHAHPHLHTERSRSGSGGVPGQAGIDDGEVRAGVLEDAFWEALFQPQGA